MLLPPLLLFEEARATRIVEATVSRCMLEGSTFVLTFVRILCALPVIYHGRFWRFETHIIEVAFLPAQRGTVVHHVRVVTMNFIHKSFATTTYQNPSGVSWWTQWWYLHFHTRNINNCMHLFIFLHQLMRMPMNPLGFWALHNSLHIEVCFIDPSSSRAVVTS